MSEKTLGKSAKFFCEKCEYKTDDKKDYDKHIATRKHKLRTKEDNVEHKNTIIHICSVCNKIYKARSGLWSHKKKCIQHTNYKINKINNIDDVTGANTYDINDDKKQMLSEDMDLKKIIFELITQNKELQKTITEMIPKIGNTNNNSNNINIKIDNITLLNDKCKDAISMSEFINSIDIGVKQLLFTSQKGLANGISNLFIEQLNNLPLVKRPIWCSDKKRKKIFIKEDEWSEDTNQIKTKQAIKNLTVKQTKNINKYTNENPDWMQHDKKKDKYIEIVKEATSEMDENKQTTIINSLLDTIHLTSDYRESIQNNTGLTN